ncbi:hypothetical protein DMENIID0001_084500 [Sergentomyia squamirostris]
MLPNLNSTILKLKMKQIRFQLRSMSNLIKPVGTIKVQDNIDVQSSVKPYESIPGPSRFRILTGYLPGGKFKSMSFGDFHRSLHQEYGLIYKVTGVLGDRDVVVLHDPGDFKKIYNCEGPTPKKILLECLGYYRKVVRKENYPNTVGVMNEQGKDWWNIRQKANSVLMRPQIVENYIPNADSVSIDFSNRLGKLRDSNLETPPDLYFLLITWSVESLFNIMIHKRLGLLGDNPNEEYVKLVRDGLEFTRLICDISLTFSFWKRTQMKRFISITDDIVGTIRKITDEAMQDTSNDVGNPLKTILEGDKNAASIIVEDSILAGFETTSAAVFSVLYCLAINPEKQEILRSEVLTALPEKTSQLTAENLSNLPYLEACIKEALRLLPVVGNNFRLASQDLVLQGYQVPKDTHLLLNNELSHKDSRYFKDPESYIPERWLQNTELRPSTYHPLVVLPFGFGARNCVGQRIAKIQIKSLLLRMLRNYRLEWQHPAPEMEFYTINSPSGDLRLRLCDI